MRSALPDKLEAGRKVGDRSWGAYGKFFVRGPDKAVLCIIASGGDDDDEQSEGWEHVSVSAPGRTPTWAEMCFVKDLFWEETECVVQYHPPRADYVNNHPYCLHLWRNKRHEFQRPPAIMVGLKGAGVLNATEAAILNAALGR